MTIFVTGTATVFNQSTAPTLWTKDTTFNECALRVVNGTAGSGGSQNFSTVHTSQTMTGTFTVSGSTAGYGLPYTQLPNHTHTMTKLGLHTGITINGLPATGIGSYGPVSTPATGVAGTGSPGSGNAHSHSLGPGLGLYFIPNSKNFSVNYIDCIIAIKT